MINLTFKYELDDAEVRGKCIYSDINMKGRGCKIFHCTDGLWVEKGKPLNLDALSATQEGVNLT